MDNNIALENLKILDSILRNNNVTYWLTDGTLLGYYRVGTFIGHDIDTDIGIMFKDFSSSILKEIVQNGFTILHIFGLPLDSLEISLFKSGVITDLFFYYERPENTDLIYHCAFVQQVNRIDYEYKKFKTKEIEFLGHKFLVPENELEFIETKYGLDWKIPDKNWDWAYDPKNHKKTEIVIDLDEQNRQLEEWLKL